MTCKSFDLPPVTPVANENISAFGLNDRVTAISGDFFVDGNKSAQILTGRGLSSEVTGDNITLRVGGDVEVVELGRKSAAALNRIVEVAQKLNAVSDGDLEDLAKNS